MIRLGLNLEPLWLNLTPGREPAVRVYCRPLDTLAYQTAQIRAAREAQERLRAAADLVASGASVTGLPDPDDQAAVAALGQVLFATGLAQAAIADWEGVGDADGQPVPVTAEWVRRLMAVAPLADEFLHQYTAVYREMYREGEGYAPSPNGSSVAAPLTAPDAVATACPVRGESTGSTASAAPTGRTH